MSISQHETLYCLEWSFVTSNQQHTTFKSHEPIYRAEMMLEQSSSDW